MAALRSPRVSASPCVDQFKSNVRVREARLEDLECPSFLDHYFSSAASGVGRDLEITATRTLLARAGRTSGWFRLFAQTQEGASGCLLVEDKPWDTDILSVPTKSVTLLVGRATTKLRSEIASHLIEKWFREQATAEREYLVTRIPADDIALLHAFEGSGFRVLVPMVTLGKINKRRANVTLPPGIEVSKVEEHEAGQVEEISASAFQWGRFVADPNVPPEAAQKIHGTWARNCCRGSQAEQVFVARREREVLGFIALKSLMAGDTRVGSIELIAASETARGIGVGRALLQVACNWFAECNQQVIVRTELPNTAALRLYESEDFRILNGSLYLSLLRAAARCSYKMTPTDEG